MAIKEDEWEAGRHKGYIRVLAVLGVDISALISNF